MSSRFEGLYPRKEVPSSHAKVETRTDFPEMLVFDIDGVITEPLTGVVELAVVSEIINLLEGSEPVAFNTGRGLNWVLRDILPYFEKQISDRSLLRNLCIVYQKGAFRITFNEKGEQERPVAASGISLIPDTLRAEALALIVAKYADTMFPGEEKEAVISPQMKPGVDFAMYKADQKRLVNDLRLLLRRHHLDAQYRVDPTRIATDVEDKHLGKSLGSQQVLAWLKERNLHPARFIAFGDSKSDVAMAEEFHRKGFSVELVFVGEKDQLDEMHLPFPVSFTQAICEKGTVEYLKNRTRQGKG